MGKSIFEMVATWINGSREPKQPKEDKKDIPGQNSIEKIGNLKNEIISQLKSNYRGRERECKMDDKILSIIISDSIFYDSVASSDFKSNLETSVSERLGFTFNKIEIKKGHIPEGTIEVFPGVHLGTRSAIRRATITPVENNATLEAEYHLDSEEIMRLPNCRYNIGRERCPITANAILRENQIAIDKRYGPVSRSHANISFSKDHGFLLNVEERGTRTYGKNRTQVQRGGEMNELNNPRTSFPLKDGDYIILGNCVHLLFRETEV